MDDDKVRLVAVPSRMGLEAMRRTKRAQAAQALPSRSTVAIPFHSIQNPSDAQTYARLLLAQQRTMGYDFRDAPTAQDAAGQAEEILKRSQQQLNVHMTTDTSTKLSVKTDIGTSSGQYWSSLNQEFRELSTHPSGGRMDTSSGFWGPPPVVAPPVRSQYLPSMYPPAPPSRPGFPPGPPPQSYPSYPPSTPYAPQPPMHAPMSYCRYCRSSHVDGARFCHYCGTPITTLPPTRDRPADTARTGSPPEVPTPMPSRPVAPSTHATPSTHALPSQYSDAASQLSQAPVNPPSTSTIASSRSARPVQQDVTSRHSTPASLPKTQAPLPPPSDHESEVAPDQEPPKELVQESPPPGVYQDPASEKASPGSPASKKNTAVALSNEEAQLSDSTSLPPDPEPMEQEPPPQPSTPKKKPMSDTHTKHHDPANEKASPGSPASKKNTAVALENDIIDLSAL